MAAWCMIANESWCPWRVDGERFSRGYERGKWKMCMVSKKTGNKRGTGGYLRMLPRDTGRG